MITINDVVANLVLAQEEFLITHEFGFAFSTSPTPGQSIWFAYRLDDTTKVAGLELVNGVLNIIEVFSTGGHKTYKQINSHDLSPNNLVEPLHDLLK